MKQKLPYFAVLIAFLQTGICSAIATEHTQTIINDSGPVNIKEESVLVNITNSKAPENITEETYSTNGISLSPVRGGGQCSHSHNIYTRKHRS